MSMPLSHFVPAYPSPFPCPQVHSLRLRLYSCPGRRILNHCTTREALNVFLICGYLLTNKAEDFFKSLKAIYISYLLMASGFES